MTPRHFSSLGLLALLAPSMAMAGPLELRVMPGLHSEDGRPSLIDDGPTTDGPAEEPENGMDDPAIDIPVGEISCNLEQPADYIAPVGGLLELQWDMSGYQSPEVFIALYSDSHKEGSFERNLMVENTGSFQVALPPDLHPEQDYFVYIETAADGRNNKVCSSLARLVIRAPECEMVQADLYDAMPGERLDIEWLQIGDDVPDVYITVVSGPEDPIRFLEAIVPNDGYFGWAIPRDMDPALDYQVYLEAAGGGSQVPFCSNSSPLFVWAE